MFKKKIQTEEVQDNKQEVAENQVEPEESQEEQLTEEGSKDSIDARNVLLNHEARISAIEAALFRLKALI